MAGSHPSILEDPYEMVVIIKLNFPFHLFQAPPIDRKVPEQSQFKNLKTLLSRKKKNLKTQQNQCLNQLELMDFRCSLPHQLQVERELVHMQFIIVYLHMECRKQKLSGRHSKIKKKRWSTFSKRNREK